MSFRVILAWLYFTGLPYWYALHSVTGIILFGPEAYW